MDTTSPTTLPRHKLPIGLQILVKLRDQDCHYVDKSGLTIDQVGLEVETLE